MNRRAGMEGQVTPLVAVAVLLAGGIALVVGHIGGMLADHAQGERRLMLQRSPEPWRVKPLQKRRRLRTGARSSRSRRQVPTPRFGFEWATRLRSPGAPRVESGSRGDGLHTVNDPSESGLPSEHSPATDTAGEDPSRTLHRVPGDGPDSPPTSATEAPPPRRARRVTPDPGISATAVADPLLAADAAAAEASNGNHADGDNGDGNHPGEVTAPPR